MSNNVRIDISGDNEKLNKSLNESEGMVNKFGKGITTVFAAVAAAAATIYVGKKLFDWGAYFVDAAAQSQEAEAKLSAVMKATGNAAGFTTEQLVAMSEQLQETTKFEAETTQGAQAILASFRNVRGDVFLDATRAAQDMATVMGTDLNGAALQLGKALNDPIQGITALKRAGVTFTDSQEEMINTLIESGDVMAAQRIILDEVANEFGGAAEEVGRSFTGRMEQMKNRFGDIAESLGAAIMPIVEELMPIVEGFAAFCENILVPVVEDVVGKLIEWGKAIIEELQPAFDWLIDAATVAFTVVETVIENFSAVWNLTINGIALGMVKFVENVKYWFTEVMPAYISWFVDNFTNLMYDAANFQATILMNMGKNIGEFIKTVMAWMKGDKADFKMTGLLEGFESTLSELPQIAERVKSGAEKMLEDEISRDAGTVGKAYADNLRKNQEAMGTAFDRAEKPAVDMTDNANRHFNPEDFTTKDGKEKKKEKEKDEKQKKGDTENLEDLNKRISAAALKDNEKERQKQLQESMKNLTDKNQTLVAMVHKGAEAAFHLVKANNTLEKAMYNIGGLMGSATSKAMEGAEKLVDKASNALGVDLSGMFSGFGEMMGTVGTDIEKLDAALESREQATVTTDEEILAQLQTNNKTQSEVYALFGQLISIGTGQLQAVEETNELLPTVGGLR